MNSKQAARAVKREKRQTKNAKLQEMEYIATMQAADIQDYVKAMIAVINGDSPCNWCESQEECQRDVKGKGCSEWWLKYREDHPLKNVIRKDEELVRHNQEERTAGGEAAGTGGGSVGAVTGGAEVPQGADEEEPDAAE